MCCLLYRAFIEEAKDIGSLKHTGPDKEALNSEFSARNLFRAPHSFTSSLAISDAVAEVRSRDRFYAGSLVSIS